MLDMLAVPAFGALKNNARKAEKAQRKLMRDYMRMVEKANRANELRYQQILGEHGSLYGRTMRGLETVGEAQRAQLREEDRRIRADARQSTISRGMAGTTVADTLNRAATRQSGVAARALEEEARLRKINADTAMTGQRMAFMERKTEQGPDPNVLRMQMSMAAQPSSGMQAFNRLLDEGYRLANTTANIASAFSGGSPAAPGPSPAATNNYQAPANVPAQPQTAPPIMPMSTGTAGMYQQQATAPMSPGATAYYGNRGYDDWMMQQRRERQINFR